MILPGGVEERRHRRWLGLCVAVLLLLLSSNCGVPLSRLGRAMHEEPDVPNRGRRGKGPALEPGVVLAIEPMLIAGGSDLVLELDDGWTVASADASLAAHVEHTVLVTEQGPEILTRL